MFTAVVEGQRLDRDQRLVVIHRERSVVPAPRAGMEHGVGGKRSERLDPRVPQLRHRRGYDGVVLRAHGAVLARMGIEASDREARMRKPKRSVNSRATMRPVRTINSVVRHGATADKGMWTVTGTTARSSLHSIMTG